MKRTKLVAKEELMVLMLENGMNPTDLSKEIAVSRITIVNILNGKGTSPKTAKLICDFFNVSMWDYFKLEKVG